MHTFIVLFAVEVQGRIYGISCQSHQLISFLKTILYNTSNENVENVTDS